MVNNLGFGPKNLSVNVTVNGDCPNRAYKVLVLFGTRRVGTDGCNGHKDIERELSPGQSAIFSVDTETVSLGDGEEYCYIVHIDGVVGESTLPQCPPF